MDKPVFEFDRYVGGKLMSEGVIVERATTLEEAIPIAVRLARETTWPLTDTIVLIWRGQ